MSEHLQRLLGRYPALQTCRSDLVAALEALTSAYESGNKVLVCGNGGSAADSEHMVAELMKGFLHPRPIPSADAARLAEIGGKPGAAIGEKLQAALPTISLVSQTSLLSAIANDVAAEMVFAQQVYGLGRPGDILFGITTSGNSANVINAVLVAKTFGLKTIALTGPTGGKVAALADFRICADANSVAAIQELHVPIYHWLCIELEEKFFG